MISVVLQGKAMSEQQEVLGLVPSGSFSRLYNRSGELTGSAKEVERLNLGGNVTKVVGMWLDGAGGTDVVLSDCLLRVMRACVMSE